MDEREVVERLRSRANPRNVAGMARFGIKAKNVYGVATPDLRKLTKEIGRDHALALRLWQTGNYEARIIASMIDEPGRVTEEQMEDWVKEFDSWAVCDGVCINLFWQTPCAYRKATEWSKRAEEFVKRAGFTLLAKLAMSDKKAGDASFEAFLGVIQGEATDERNFVKKAVNWALRQIGKRNVRLNQLAIETAEEIRKLDDRTARWIAADALRELRSEAVKSRLKIKV